MSTKIYNAYRTSATLAELHALFIDARKRLKENHAAICRAILTDTFRNLMATPVKRKGVEGKISWADLVFKGKVFACSWCDEAIGPIRSILAGNLHAVVYPIADGEYKGELLFQLFGGAVLAKMFTEDEIERYGIKDFHYQNQADPPDDVPGDEWMERERVWENLFEADDKSYTPAGAGFSYELLSNFDAWLAIWIAWAHAEYEALRDYKSPLAVAYRNRGEGAIDIRGEGMAYSSWKESLPHSAADRARVFIRMFDKEPSRRGTRAAHKLLYPNLYKEGKPLPKLP